MIHLLREAHLEKICPICGENNGENEVWKPEFWNGYHYKTRDCPRCGHKIFIKTEALCSGHYD